MINLSFYLPEPGSPWRETWEAANRIDPADVTETDLRYRYFGVNVEMIVGSVEVISRRRFVTLADLSLSLLHAKQRISTNEDAAFGFTESEEVISLHCNEDFITFHSSKRPWEVTAGRDETMSCFDEFARAAHLSIVSEVPGLAEHPVIKRLSFM